MHRPHISVIVPMYNEADGLEQLWSRLVPVLEGLTPEWEILCVNDGSTDNTLAILRAVNAQEPRVRYVSLSRNFGKEAALTAGLFHTQAQAVIPFDADLQDPPELIPALVEQWQKGFKVVLATRQKRMEEGWLKRVTAQGFYRMMSRISTVPIPENTGDFRLMDASVVEQIKHLPERTRFMKGLFAWVGFSTAQVFYDRPSRLVGKSKQNYRNLWRLAKDGIFSFTTLPLRITTYLGIIISLFSFGYAAFLMIRTIWHGIDVPGYASIMVVVLCMGGIQLISIGILGEYVGRSYRETKQRPLYIIEETSAS